MWIRDNAWMFRISLMDEGRRRKRKTLRCSCSVNSKGILSKKIKPQGYMKNFTNKKDNLIIISNIRGT